MGRAAHSEAERLRAHRQAFLLAQELGCTPAEAEAVMAAREAKARWEETRQRLETKMNGPIAADHRPDWNAPWMMQE